jgi:hypothetical protein
MLLGQFHRRYLAINYGCSAFYFDEEQRSVIQLLWPEGASGIVIQ